MAYVYGHYRKDTGELFYVGKGTGRRAWSKRGRNGYWHNVVNTYGYEVKIIHDNLTEEDAFDKEKELIAEVGLSNLTNMAEGGMGMSSVIAQQRSQRPEYREKIKEVGKLNAQNPEWKRKISEGLYRTFANPEVKERISVGLRKKYKDPEYRRKCKLAVERRTANPDYIAKMKKDVWDNAEVRKKQSEARKQWWERKRNN